MERYNQSTLQNIGIYDPLFRLTKFQIFMYKDQIHKHLTFKNTYVLKKFQICTLKAQNIQNNF